MNTFPRNDAAPLAGGAGVKDPSDARDLIQSPPVPPSHHKAPAGTSELAAEKVATHAPSLRQRILAYIAARNGDGATDDEAESALGIKPQTYTPRRGELVKLGLVVDSEFRRNTTSGRPAAVWGTPNHAPKPEGATQ
jgi:hypothetical protein